MPNAHERSVFMSRENSTYDVETIIKAIDLIKVANQLYHDGMEYVQIGIHFDDYDDEHNGELRIFAVPSSDSSEVKKYPPIPPSSLCYFQ